MCNIFGKYMPEKLVDGLEESGCFMYGFPGVKQVNTVLALMLMVGEGETIKKTVQSGFVRASTL